MQEKTRLKLKIISSFSMCVLSLFSVVSLTLSWFAINNKTHGNGMSITSSDDNELLGYEYFSVKKNAANTYGLTEISGISPSLGAYDALSSDYSVAVKVYLRCPEGITAATFTARTAADYFLGDAGYRLLPPQTDNPSMPLADGKTDSGKSYTNSLTSLVAFAALTNEESAALSGGTATSLPSGTRLSSFIDLNNQADGKHVVSPTVAVTQTGNGAASSAVELQNDTYRGEDCRSAYIFITYEPLLVNTVFSANIGNDKMYVTNAATGEPYPIPFVCDFSIEIAAGGN